MGKKFVFVDNAKKFFIISIVLMVLTLVCSLVLGVELDIQFRGGSIATYSYEGTLETGDFQSKVEEILNQSVSVQQSRDLQTNGEIQTMVVTLPGSQTLTSEEQVALNGELAAAYPDNSIVAVSLSNVDPSMGREMLLKSLVAIVLALLLLIIYIGIRFRKIGGISAAVTAVIALLHDAVIAYAVFVVCGIGLNDNFIVVILTIFGFSLNNTVVVYDRVRENQRLYGRKMGLREVMDLSINQSMSRSVNTSATTIAALVVMTVVAIIFNVSSIISFSLPLIFGLISGTYTSLCIAGPLWVLWQEKRGVKK